MAFHANDIGYRAASASFNLASKVLSGCAPVTIAPSTTSGVVLPIRNDGVATILRSDAVLICFATCSLFFPLSRQARNVPTSSLSLPASPISWGSPVFPGSLKRASASPELGLISGAVDRLGGPHRVRVNVQREIVDNQPALPVSTYFFTISGSVVVSNWRQKGHS